MDKDVFETLEYRYSNFYLFFISGFLEYWRRIFLEGRCDKFYGFVRIVVNGRSLCSLGVDILFLIGGFFGVYVDFLFDFVVVE